jgi:hypothetical protein
VELVGYFGEKGGVFAYEVRTGSLSELLLSAITCGGICSDQLCVHETGDAFT